MHAWLRRLRKVMRRYEKRTRWAALKAGQEARVQDQGATHSEPKHRAVPGLVEEECGDLDRSG